MALLKVLLNRFAEYFVAIPLGDADTTLHNIEENNKLTNCNRFSSSLSANTERTRCYQFRIHLMDKKRCTMVMIETVAIDSIAARDTNNYYFRFMVPVTSRSPVVPSWRARS